MHDGHGPACITCTEPECKRPLAPGREIRGKKRGPIWNRGPEIESSAAKVTWQVDETNTVVSQFTNYSTGFAAFAPFDRGYAENLIAHAVGALQSSVVDRIPGDIYALERQSQDGNFEKLQLNSAIRQDMSLEALPPVAAVMRSKTAVDTGSRRASRVQIM